MSSRRHIGFVASYIYTVYLNIISIKFIFQQYTIKYHKMLHNHIDTRMKPDDTLLAVARAAEAHRAGNRIVDNTINIELTPWHHS